MELLRKLKSRLALIHLSESSFLSKARKWWSGFLAACIVVSVIFQIVLTTLIGVKKLDFHNYTSFLSVVAGGTFVQIVGLAGIALKWTFGGRRPDEMLQDARSTVI